MVGTVKFLALCSSRDLGDLLVRRACAEPMEGWGMRQVDGQEVRLETLAGDPRQNPYWHHHVRDAQALIVLARFMDILSMDGLKILYRSLPLDSSIPPLVFFVLREQGEADYKLSCQECGQKLWVRDEDVGKAGRCPNCRTAFKIPAQLDFLREQLALPDNLPVEAVVLEDSEDLNGALRRLMRRVDAYVKPTKTAAEMQADIMKRSTIRIQIPENITD
jgi:DNA-directed RNA polymerase subunit RPC12/RpoP